MSSDNMQEEQSGENFEENENFEEIEEVDIPEEVEEPIEEPQDEGFNIEDMFRVDPFELRVLLNIGPDYNLLEVDEDGHPINIDPDVISDLTLSTYADLVRSRVLAKISSVMDLEKLEDAPYYVTQLIEETIIAGIACHISMVDPTILCSPADYKVGDVEERFDTSIFERTPSWCDYYKALLDDLLDKIRPKGHLLTYKRRGLAYHRGWSHRI